MKIQIHFVLSFPNIAERNDCLDGFRCNDFTCLPNVFKCDGVEDCSDGEDEDINICKEGNVALCRIISSEFRKVGETGANCNTFFPN